MKPPFRSVIDNAIDRLDTSISAAVQEANMQPVVLLRDVGRDMPEVLEGHTVLVSDAGNKRGMPILVPPPCKQGTDEGADSSSSSTFARKRRNESLAKEVQDRIVKAAEAKVAKQAEASKKAGVKNRSKTELELPKRAVFGNPERAGVGNLFHGIVDLSEAESDSDDSIVTSKYFKTSSVKAQAKRGKAGSKKRSKADLDQTQLVEVCESDDSMKSILSEEDAAFQTYFFVHLHEEEEMAIEADDADCKFASLRKELKSDVKDLFPFKWDKERWATKSAAMDECLLDYDSVMLGHLDYRLNHIEDILYGHVHELCMQGRDGLPSSVYKSWMKRRLATAHMGSIIQNVVGPFVEELRTKGHNRINVLRFKYHQYLVNELAKVHD